MVHMNLTNSKVNYGSDELVFKHVKTFKYLQLHYLDIKYLAYDEKVFSVIFIGCNEEVIDSQVLHTSMTERHISDLMRHLTQRRTKSVWLCYNYLNADVELSIPTNSDMKLMLNAFEQSNIPIHKELTLGDGDFAVLA